jgi:hypothetical protein
MLARLPQVEAILKQVNRSSFVQTDNNAGLKKTPIINNHMNRPLTYKYAYPYKAKRGESYLLEITPQDFGITEKVSEVMIDLTPLGRPIHAVLLDDGKWADKLPFDQTFSLMIAISDDVPIGKLRLPVFFKTAQEQHLEGHLNLTIQ